MAIRICTPLKKPIAPSSCMIFLAAYQKLRYFMLSRQVLIPSRACISKCEELFGRTYTSGWASAFLLRMLQTTILSHRLSVQPCVLSFVLITSSGVVGMAAMAPAIPPQRQYLNPWSPSFTPKQCLRVSLKATIRDPKGMFMAQLTGKLRQKASGPSRFRTDETTSPIDTFNFSDRINCTRCLRASVGVMIRS